jgi:hypothetical protein
MAEFIITTTDSEYTYNSPDAVGIKFNPKTNNKTSDTQGFLPKVQKGKLRYEPSVTLKVTRANYETIFLPMLEYSSDVNVTFDREIPGRNTATGRFIFYSMNIEKEFDGGLEYEISIRLKEVLYTQ